MFSSSHFTINLCDNQAIRPTFGLMVKKGGEEWRNLPVISGFGVFDLGEIVKGDDVGVTS